MREGNRLSVWRKYIITNLEIMGFLVIGFILTENVLRYIYEGFGIRFMGNVWVNWFGLSYLLFFIYTLTCSLFVNNNNDIFRKRIKSIAFWILFIGSVYAINIPFIKGENPF